jgi:hypothetical protein
MAVFGTSGEAHLGNLFLPMLLHLIEDIYHQHSTI